MENSGTRALKKSGQSSMRSIAAADNISGAQYMKITLKLSLSVDIKIFGNYRSQSFCEESAISWWHSANE